MRIGELAALAGVSTRTVRHYHHLGLLPEPERRANGYREYALRDAVLLARVRRLTELGLSLDEVRDVLAEDAGRALHEVLAELDADLARQEAEIRERRSRLRTLLRRAEEHGGLPAEGPVSEELADVFGRMARASAARPGPEPAMAATERELMALFESMGTGSAEVSTLLGSALEAPGAMDRAYEVYALLDELAEAAVDDPRVDRAARALCDCLPDEMAAQLAAGAQEALAAEEARPGDAAAARALMDAFYAHFAPAQAAAIRQAIRLFAERAR
ncbi:MerR family transcriptional regulator [Streptomyces sp. Ru73]|uniref:MerR family transcriptional regulator n=1 Tax=Streptomyces sp. Ru73 TaxID=2080748 RepID=UPI000CDE05FB|nr:MerR family transcriptional regulator [Streptomyces sp. Ru73]POX37609.1 MerR family transcriptional regulator [Streptomyces sp. Ru73]